ncbi:hypothetical protein A5700_00800 [Mycobacterium sp. E1214]|nr:hypothetical protein A5700_00800 [Mycobacterium sp. E1214]OBH24701.1 hypothetical protein A5693_07390 [Mycobacterium sp. E1319]
MSERITAITEDSLPPEYFTAQRVADETKRKLNELAAPSDVSAPHPLDTGEITDEWINDTAELETRRRQWERRRGVLLTLANDARGRAQSLRDAQKSNILAAYNDELNRLLDRAHELSGELRGVDTAHEAIANDRGPQWKALTQLTEDYHELRVAQHALMSHDVVFSAKAKAGEDHASDLYLKNLDDIWPGWRTAQSDDSMQYPNGGRPSTRREPWPDEPAALMLWLVRSKAEPWIPSEADLERLRQRRIAKANPIPKLIRDDPAYLNKPTKKGR